MKPSTHRYILAPALIGIHALLLLPLVFPPKVLRPPHFPDASGHPWPDYDPTPQIQKLERLHLKYSVPLGFAGIAGVWISKQLAGGIPLPKDPRKKLLAMWLESSVLFGIGVLEEIWRYGLVRLLVIYMGGHGGYRGTTLTKRDDEDIEGPPTLWEGLYIMAWVWSIFECLVCRTFISFLISVLFYYNCFNYFCTMFSGHLFLPPMALTFAISLAEVLL